MGDISKNFSRSEFACEDGCEFNCVDIELLGILEALRHHFGEPVTITSGNRCRRRNMFVGGFDQSYHILGMAVDIRVNEISPRTVYVYLDEKYPNKYGIGNGFSFTHIDVRSTKARWTY